MSTNRSPYNLYSNSDNPQDLQHKIQSNAHSFYSVDEFFECICDLLYCDVKMFCEWGNEPSGSMKCGEFIDWLKTG
jgi:hypothetical protein